MKCKYCKQEKPIEEFEIAARTETKIYLRLKCKRCKQDTQNKRRLRNRAWLDAYKAGQVCASCGINDFRVLDFHHKKNKKENVSNMLTWSQDEIYREIKKCTVLCANCHRILHYTRGVAQW